MITPRKTKRTKTIKYFPIKTDTACRLKWSWSSLYLNTGTTASCHRSSVSTLSLEEFSNFHNTPSKLEARKIMLDGKWPGNGCEYCRDIESSGGHSDRQFQLGVADIYPHELDSDPTLLTVEPTVLEVFFSNVCNFKCVYCKPSLSSQIQAEEEAFGSPIVASGHALTDNAHKDYVPVFWEWFRKNGHNLKRFHMLGGEPFLQKDFFALVSHYESNPNPDLEFNIVTNLHIPEARLHDICKRLQSLVDNKCVKRIDLLASVDSWGPGQEYVRHGFNRTTFEKNLKILFDYKVFRVGLLSTVCSLTIHELPALVNKFNEWNQIQELFWYMHLVLPNDKSPFSPTMFDYSTFEQSLTSAQDLLPTATWDNKSTLDVFNGIVSKIKELAVDNLDKQKELLQILNEIDRRRGVSWRQSFPWLMEKHKHVV